ncbi:CST complex subunit CTC1 [Platanthera guangdongensis]|uniref:CST complex subunit CTC1 n=1 Tax=Platanthera guangdongensis TaxID=2320717 RepID=A0ABR2MTW1_9ASPA
MSLHSITISDLLSLSRPLTGAASLSPSSSHPSPLKKHKPPPPPVTSTLTVPLLSDTTTNPDHFFTPLNRPVLLVGSVDLPIDPYNHFLSISDGSSTICCAVLDFDLKIIGCSIHVLAWNFLPFKPHGGGLLEVIRWSIFPSLALSKDMPTLSLQKGLEFSEEKSIVGVLISVSPVFTVPCRNQGPGSDSVGFLTDIYTCNCSFCTKSCSLDRFGCSLWRHTNHCFSISKFVYFVAPSAWWRLALAKLAGKVIMVSGLKKKMIFVGEKTSYAMYTTTLETSISACQFPVDICTRVIEEGAVYNGVVTGVYMHGMVVELDDKVWLLVTDTNIVPLAAVRVGAIHGIFMEFCQHRQSASKKEKDKTPFKLTDPTS